MISLCRSQHLIWLLERSDKQDKLGWVLTRCLQEMEQQKHEAMMEKVDRHGH